MGLTILILLEYLAYKNSYLDDFFLNLNNQIFILLVKYMNMSFNL